MSNIKASWTIDLWCECPSCKEDVNLLDYDDFWCDRELDACEQGTDRSRDMDVICPKCCHEFQVDLEY